MSIIIRHTETEASEVDKANGTYYYEAEVSDRTEWGIQIQITGATTTVTVEGSAKVSPTSSDYIDVTNDIFGVASVTATKYLFDTNNKIPKLKKLRFKVVTTSGTDDYTITVTSRQLK